MSLLADPEVRSRYAAIGVVPGGNTPEEFADLIRADHLKWGKVVKDTGVKIE